MFKRNTRNIKLTEFGEQFLPKAIQYLAEGERLFSINNVKDKAMQGVVRITLPPMPYNDEILFELLTALEPYSDIAIDWRVGTDKLKSVDDQIDIGLRICQEPELDWVAQHICTFSEKIVASPTLLKRLDFPKDLQDLAQNYLLSGLIDPKLKRIWQWQINAEQRFIPNRTILFASDVQSDCNQHWLDALALILSTVFVIPI